jgi:myo-inositol-1(or 4)-monophosphatase
VEEAGGRTSGMRGEALALHGQYVLADNGLIHEEIVQLFAEIFRGEYRNQMPGLPAAEWEMHHG